MDPNFWTIDGAKFVTFLWWFHWSWWKLLWEISIVQKITKNKRNGYHENPRVAWCTNLMLLPGRVDLSAGLLLPRHLSGDPIIESIQEKPPKIWNKNKNERNSRAVSTAYRENAEWVPSRSSQDIWRSWKIQVPMRNNHSKEGCFRVVFVSQSNQLDHTELTELVWVTFRGIYFRRLFHLGAAVLWQRFPDSPRPALIMIYLYLLNIPLIFKSSRQSWAVRVFAVTSCG